MHWPPLPPEIIADPNITDRCFRAFIRLYARAWNGTFLTPLRITETDLSGLLHKSRAQMYSLLAEMKSANLIRWHRDGRHFRITPNFQPPVPFIQNDPNQESQNPDPFFPQSGKPDSYVGVSGFPDSKASPNLEIQIPSLESRVPRQVKKPGLLKELIKFDDVDEFSGDQHHHQPSVESGFPDSTNILEAVRAQAEDWLIRAGVWNDRAGKLACTLAENEILHPQNHLPTRVDILSWLVALKNRGNVNNLPAMLWQNLDFGRTAPAKFRPPCICQTCRRVESYCQCDLPLYHYPDALLDRALDPNVGFWVCCECHALPCACIHTPATQISANAESFQVEPVPKVPVEIIGWDGSGIPPERAWHVALAQLQLQVPKATFDKWVGGTWLVRWEFDASADLFVVACPDSLTCDWLTERVTLTLIRILAGVCNRPVKVTFVLAETCLS